MNKLFLLSFCFFSHLSFAELIDKSPVHKLAQACCKICRSGQACGNSCISWAKTCRVGPGCACQGFQLDSEELNAEAFKLKNSTAEKNQALRN